VGFVEPIIGEFIQKVPDFDRLFLINTIFGGTRQKLGLFGVHRFLDFLTHGAPQQVSATKAIARHFLRDLHHLFLVNDDALGFVQNMIDGRMQRITIADAVLDLAELGDVLHRAGTIQRHQCDNVFDAMHPSCRWIPPETRQQF